MSDLRGRIDQLEHGMSGQPWPARWRASLEPYFTASVYDEHRTALLDALCGPNPTYHFEAYGGPDRGRYSVFWWARSGAPVILRIQRVESSASCREGVGEQG